MKHCSVCRHPKRLDIETALLKGQSLRTIAKELGASAWSIRRHEHHLPQQFAKEQLAKDMPADIATADDLLGRIEELMARCERIAVAAEQEKKWTPAIGALREIRNCLDLLARLRGQLDASQVNVHVDQVTINTGGDPEIQIALLIARVTHDFEEEPLRRFKMLALRESRAHRLLEVGWYFNLLPHVALLR